mmetsp:Transcript_63817/g.177035  ORF Transcript_63817/g.177035 Transcript_63817/m.177035 type:complete len:226 (-) Transcript_63817:1813-2490(-)
MEAGPQRSFIGYCFAAPGRLPWSSQSALQQPAPALERPSMRKVARSQHLPCQDSPHHSHCHQSGQLVALAGQPAHFQCRCPRSPPGSRPQAGASPALPRSCRRPRVPSRPGAAAPSAGLAHRPPCLPLDPTRSAPLRKQLAEPVPPPGPGPAPGPARPAARPAPAQPGRLRRRRPRAAALPRRARRCRWRRAYSSRSRSACRALSCSKTWRTCRLSASLGRLSRG